MVVVILMSLGLARTSDAQQMSYMIKWRSQYTGSVTGNVIYNKPVVQGMATAAKGPFYAYVWGCVPTRSGWNRDWASEIDYGVGYASNIWRGQANVNVEYCFFDLMPVGHWRGDVHDLTTSLTANRGLVRPFISVDSCVPDSPNILEGGMFWRVGVKSSIKGCNLELSAGGNDGAFGAQPELVSHLRLIIKRPIAAGKVTLVPEIALQKSVGSSSGCINDTITTSLEVKF
jgi:hypothetical protein